MEVSTVFNSRTVVMRAKFEDRPFANVKVTNSKEKRETKAGMFLIKASNADVVSPEETLEEDIFGLRVVIEQYKK